MGEPGGIVGEGMRAYYEQRACEYDDWWLGEGVFARRERAGWAGEVAAVLAAVEALEPARVLDVACGTGFVTRHLRGDVVGVDQSETMVAIAAERAPFLAEARRVAPSLVVLDAHSSRAASPRSGRSASSTTARATGSTSASSPPTAWPPSSAAGACCTPPAGS